MTLPQRATLAMGILACVATAFLSACGPGTPFHEKAPFVQTKPPADFAIVLDENYSTYYARTHITQTISAASRMSRTTYTVRRDFNDTISQQYTQEHPLNDAQVQAMWDEVVKQELLQGAMTWFNWRSDSDWYKHSETILQIRGDGKGKSYTQVNHWDGALRELALLIDSVRLPIGGGTGYDATQPVQTVPMTPENPGQVVPSELATMPTTMPAAKADLSTDAIGDTTLTPATAPAPATAPTPATAPAIITTNPSMDASMAVPVPTTAPAVPIR